LPLWRAIAGAARNGGGGSGAGYVFHESSVGAGLPVLGSLRELVDTGDRVRRIEGIFSGTMSFLFNAWNPVDAAAAAGGAAAPAFSKTVAEARDLGYTEPDPRDDLNGLDVARKATILARMAGLEVESATSFETQSLIPTALESAASADEFLAGLARFDGDMEKVRDAAAAEGKVVRFVGSVDVAAGKVKVGLEKYFFPHSPSRAEHRRPADGDL
jgi:homoserine dehydrogenase